LPIRVSSATCRAGSRAGRQRAAGRQPAAGRPAARRVPQRRSAVPGCGGEYGGRRAHPPPRPSPTSPPSPSSGGRCTRPPRRSRWTSCAPRSLLAEDADQRQQLANYFHQVSTIVEFQQPRLRTMVHEAVIAAGNRPKPLEKTAADLTRSYVEAMAAPISPAEGPAKTLETAWAKLAGVVIDAWAILEELAGTRHPAAATATSTSSGPRRSAGAAGGRGALSDLPRLPRPRPRPLRLSRCACSICTWRSEPCCPSRSWRSRGRAHPAQRYTRTALAPRGSTAEQKLTRRAAAPLRRVLQVVVARQRLDVGAAWTA
jgi:hypothetical protein